MNFLPPELQDGVLPQQRGEWGSFIPHGSWAMKPCPPHQRGGGGELHPGLRDEVRRAGPGSPTRAAGRSSVNSAVDGQFIPVRPIPGSSRFIPVHPGSSRIQFSAETSFEEAADGGFGRWPRWRGPRRLGQPRPPFFLLLLFFASLPASPPACQLQAWRPPARKTGRPSLGPSRFWEALFCVALG